jgi:phenol 2-monooxygenase
MSSNEVNCDVLVIGAGPAGCMAGMALARAGIDVRIIDKRPLKVAAGQADGIQPRTIEVLQSYGLADKLLAQGCQLHMAVFYDPGKDGGIVRTKRAPDVNAENPRWPHEVTFHQGGIETIFRDAMTESGVKVDQPVIPVSIQISSDESELKSSDSYPVKVTLKRLRHEQAAPLTGNPHSNEKPQTPTDTDDDESEVIRAKYVIGADGAHSWTRKQMNITMEGESTAFVWGVVDCVPETDFPDIRNKTIVHSNNGSFMVIPREGDLVRLYVQLSEVELGQAGRVDKSRMGPERVIQVAQESFKPFTLEHPKRIDWWTLYIIGQRVAASYSVKNRVFIVGDACHTHSPKAGQGMNASMNDSHNLAWKIAHVLRGWAQPDILDTYELERRKFAQDLINFDKQFSKMFSTKVRSEENPDGHTQEEFLEAFHTFGRFTSGIGIHYEASAISKLEHQALASKLIVGERFPPSIIIRTADARPYEIQDLLTSDTRFKIAIFTGDQKNPEQKKKLDTLAAAVEKEDSFIKKYTPKDLPGDAIFDIFSVGTEVKEEANFTDIPASLRRHWSKVYTDDVNTTRTIGGKAYETYGISKEVGAIAVVRPDGYVGAIAPLDGIDTLDAYFAGFMRPQ